MYIDKENLCPSSQEIAPAAKIRCVPAFTAQSRQANAVVCEPPKINVYEKRPTRRTFFRTYFYRGDIPVTNSGLPIKLKNNKNFPIKWYCDPDDLDYCYYLPIFVEGISESCQQLRYLAFYASMDLIYRGPNKILKVVPRLIQPLKKAFNTKDKKIIITALKVLSAMVLVGPCVGQAMVPFYRQLLPVCNLFKQVNVNLGSAVDPDRDVRIGDIIEDTLHILEQSGGPDAYINIKNLIPTYESCVRN